MSNLDRATLVLLIAASLDYLIADPWNFPHPVQVMGWIISQFTNLIVSQCKNNWQRRLGGVFLGVGLVAGSGFVGWLVVGLAVSIHPLLGIGVESILLASCFAGRSLRLAAADVLEPLREGKIELARSKLSLYVGRDTDNLSESEMLRAVLETIAENTPDGVTAPLFYAVVGISLGLGSVPLALAYKAASTLDSMIGYQKEPYTDIGWFSAKLEDFLTWVPCRLTVLTIALLAKQPQQVWSICRRDASQDPSPNSGWSECAYGAVLGVQLGGTNTYGGVVKHKPFLGEAIHPITSIKIEQALDLTRWCFLSWLAIVVVSEVMLRIIAAVAIASY